MARLGRRNRVQPKRINPVREPPLVPGSLSDYQSPADGSFLPPLNVSGTTYVCGIDIADPDTFHILSSTTPTDTESWTDRASGSLANTIGAMAWVLESTTIHIIAKDNNSATGAVRYWSYNTGTHTLSSVEIISGAPQHAAPTMAGVSIAYDTEPVATYTADRSLGTDFAVETRHRATPTAGEWQGTEEFLSSFDFDGFGGSLVVRSGTTYGWYSEDTTGICYRAAATPGSWGSVTSRATNESLTPTHPLTNAVVFNTGSGAQTGVAYRASDTELWFVGETLTAETVNVTPLTQSQTIAASLIVDGSDIPHIVYVASDGSIQHVERTGGSWSATPDEVEPSSVSANFVYASWVGTAIDYVYDPGGGVGLVFGQFDPSGGTVEGSATLAATSNLVTTAVLDVKATATLGATSNLVTSGTVTGAFPGLIDGVEPEASGSFRGPYTDSNGNLYTVTEEYLGAGGNGFGNHPMIMKSSNGGATWTRQDASNSPGYGVGGSYNDMESSWLLHNPGNNELVLCYMKAESRWWGVSFRTSDHPTNPDTWDTSTFATSTGQDNFTGGGIAAESAIAGAVLSDERCRAFIRGTPQSGFEAILRRERSAAKVWDSASNYITKSSSNIVRPSAVTGESDKVYLFVRDHTNGQVHYCTITSTGTVSGFTRVDTNGAGTAAATKYENNVVPPVYYDDAGTAVVVVGFVNSSDVLKTVEVRGGSVGSEQTVSNDTVTVHPAGGAGTDNQGPSAALAVYGTTLYAFWGDATSGDLYYSTRANGGSWAARTLLADTGSGNDVEWLYANHIVIGSNNYIGYTYDVGPHADDDSNINFDRMLLTTIVSGAATLAATSNLVTSGSVEVFAAATLAATSNLVTTAVLTVPAGAIDMPSTSGLTALAGNTVVATATIPATSNLVTAGAVTAEATVTLAATSSLAAEAGLDVLATATLAATSNLVTTAVLTIPATATLAATSDLVTVGTRGVEAAATLAATSDLVTAPIVTAVASVTIPVTSDLAVTAVLDVLATATLAATSNLVTAGAVIAEAIATLTASSDLAAAAEGAGEVTGSATLAATSNLTTTAVLTVPAEATLPASSDLVTSGTRAVEATATLAATSNLVTTADITVLASATLAASSDLVTSELVEVVAAATLAATSDLSTSASNTVFASATLTATSDLVTSGSIEGDAAATLAATSDLTTAEVVETHAVVTLTASSDLVVPGVVTAVASALLDVESSLVGGLPEVTVFASAILAGTSDLATVAAVTTVVAVALPGTSNLLTSASVEVLAVAVLAAVSGLDVEAGGALAGEAVLAATSNLTVSGSVEAVAAATLPAISDLITTALVPQQGEAELDAFSDLFVVGTRGVLAAAILLTTSNLVAVADVPQAAEAIIPATSNLVTGGVVTKHAEVVEMAGQATLQIQVESSFIEAEAFLEQVSDLVTSAATETAGDVVMTSVSHLDLAPFHLVVLTLKAHSWLHVTAEDELRNTHQTASLSLRRWRSALDVHSGRRYKAALD